MIQRRGDTMEEEYTDKMVENLPVLRAAAGLTQEQLGAKLGVSRQTIVAIENKKNPLTWSLYLAMVCVFLQYKQSKILLDSYKIFDMIFIRDK